MSEEGILLSVVEEKDGSPVFPIAGVEKEKIDNILKECIGCCHCVEPLYNLVIKPVILELQIEIIR